MDEITECSYCGADAHCVHMNEHAAHYLCRHCGLDTVTEFGGLGFGMHEEDEDDDFFDEIEEVDEGDIMELARQTWSELV